MRKPTASVWFKDNNTELDGRLHNSVLATLSCLCYYLYVLYCSWGLILQQTRKTEATIRVGKAKNVLQTQHNVHVYPCQLKTTATKKQNNVILNDLGQIKSLSTFRVFNRSSKIKYRHPSSWLQNFCDRTHYLLSARKKLAWQPEHVREMRVSLLWGQGKQRQIRKWTKLALRE